jgi:hypothetical protein
LLNETIQKRKAITTITTRIIIRNKIMMVTNRSRKAKTTTGTTIGITIKKWQHYDNNNQNNNWNNQNGSHGGCGGHGGRGGWGG